MTSDLSAVTNAIDAELRAVGVELRRQTLNHAARAAIEAITRTDERLREAYIEGWKAGYKVGEASDGGAIEQTRTAESDWASRSNQHVK